MRRQAGFSLIELLIVITMIGTLLAVALPRLGDSVRAEAVRGARREVRNQVVRARAVAVQRSCRATVIFSSSTEEVWVTACRTNGVGTETVGQRTNLASRYGVDMTASADSIPFLPTSLSVTTTPTTLTFTRGGRSLGMVVSSIGRASW